MTDKEKLKKLSDMKTELFDLVFRYNTIADQISIEKIEITTLKTQEDKLEEWSSSPDEWSSSPDC